MAKVTETKTDFVIWCIEGECFLDYLKNYTISEAKAYVEDEGYTQVSIFELKGSYVSNPTWVVA